jgi:hypothetical protein
MINNKRRAQRDPAGHPLKCWIPDPRIHNSDSQNFETNRVVVSQLRLDSVGMANIWCRPGHGVRLTGQQTEVLGRSEKKQVKYNNIVWIYGTCFSCLNLLTRVGVFPGILFLACPENIALLLPLKYIDFEIVLSCSILDPQLRLGGGRTGIVAAIFAHMFS